MDLTRLDANESIFFKRELEYVKAGSYDIPFRANKAVSLFPVDTSAGPAATEITYRRYNKVGTAKFIADYSHDFPRVDVYGTEYTVKPKDIGDSYGYSIPEIRRAAKAGRPLEAQRAITAREIIENKIDDVAWNGDTTHNLNGFINYPGITEYTVASGTSGSYEWSAKTSDEILADMNGAVNAVVEATNGIELPDTMLLPLAQFNIINQKRLADNSDETVLSYFMKTNRYIKRIEWIVDLKEAGASGADRGMVFVNDSQHLTLELPAPFESFEPDKLGLEYVIPCMARTAGMIIYRPASVAYFDGI